MANQNYIDLLNEKKTANLQSISQYEATLTTISQIKDQMNGNVASLDNQAIDTNNSITQLTNEIATIDEMITIFST